MKKSRKIVMTSLLAAAAIAPSANPALAAGLAYVDQYNAVKGEVSGPGKGFAGGYSFSYGDTFRNNVSYENPVAGISYNFNTANLIGASVAVGIAAAANGSKASVDVVSAQNVINLNSR